MSASRSDIYKKIGRRIRYYRKEKGFTQEVLADKAGISLSYISKIEAENCDKAFSLDVLFIISETLDIPISKFFEQL